jgi:hypothetical protein
LYFKNKNTPARTDTTGIEAGTACIADVSAIPGSAAGTCVWSLYSVIDEIGTVACAGDPFSPIFIPYSCSCADRVLVCPATVFDDPTIQCSNDEYCNATFNYKPTLNFSDTCSQETATCVANSILQGTFDSSLIGRPCIGNLAGIPNSVGGSPKPGNFTEFDCFYSKLQRTDLQNPASPITCGGNGNEPFVAYSCDCENFIQTCPAALFEQTPPLICEPGAAGDAYCSETFGNISSDTCSPTTRTCVAKDVPSFVEVGAVCIADYTNLAGTPVCDPNLQGCTNVCVYGTVEDFDFAKGCKGSNPVIYSCDCAAPPPPAGGSNNTARIVIVAVVGAFGLLALIIWIAVVCGGSRRRSRRSSRRGRSYDRL